MSASGSGLSSGTRVTIDDVAKLANVHKATVSRALNAQTRHQVSQETVQRVKRAAEELGYVPNAMARGLRTNSSMTIGVVIPDLMNPFFPPIVRGIEAYLQPRGFTALLANTDSSPINEHAALQSLLGRRVDGLILASGDQRNHAEIAGLHRSGVLAVLLNRAAGDVPYPLVTGDDAHGIELAVQHLAELGHRRLLHIAGPSELSTSTIRLRAFEAACTGHRGVEGRVVEAAALTVEAGRRSMDHAMADRAWTPSAVVASNDLIALGAMRALRAHGLECPRDVSVTGFNDIAFAEDFFPPLTTIRVPTQDMGAQAARLLLEAIDAREQGPVTMRLPVELIVRRSTGPAL